MGFHKRQEEIRRWSQRRASASALARKQRWEADRFMTWFFDSKTLTLRKQYMAKSIHDLVSSKAPAGGGTAATDSFLTENFPNLTLLLTTTDLGKGKTRTPSTLFIFAQGGNWKVCLADKDSNRCLWAESDTVGGLTRALEAILELPEVPWKAKTFQPRK